MHRFHGAWRITVTLRDADFEQRAVVRGRYGTRVLPGTPGATLLVDEEDWTLSLEHLPTARTWQPDLRTTLGPLTRRGGRVSRLVTGNDCHQAGKPLDYVNFAVLLESLDQPRPATTPAITPAAAPLTRPVPARTPHTSPAPAGAPAPVRTSSDGHPLPAIPRQRPATGPHF